MSDSKDKRIKELETEVSLLRTVLNKLPGNVYLKTLDDCFLGCNENVAKILKLTSPKDIVGKYGHEILPLELVEKTRENDREIIEKKEEVWIEEHGIDKDSNPAVYFSQKTPLHDEQGNLLGILGVSINITQQKKIEEELRKMTEKAQAESQAKSKFLAMINHEIRMPLTSILGLANFLNAEKLSKKERKKYVQHLISSGDYLLNLINKILDYSKLEANKTEAILAPTHLEKIMTDTLAILSSMAKNKKLPLHLEYAHDIPEYIVTDGHLLQQIFINLIGNAIKFTDKGHINIRVDCLQKSAYSVQLRIAIEDTGKGIPTKNLSSIFDEFYQIEDIYTRSVSTHGTGLGLAIVKKLANLLKIQIHVKSKINRGSAFYLTANFPIAKIKDVQEIQSTFKIEPVTLAKHRILLIEDNAVIQFIHHKMLSDLGYDVDIAASATKAFEMFGNNYNLIFVDIGLPDLNGFDLIKKMRTHNPYSRRIPIVALTGFSAEEEKARCKEAGADDIIAKPISEASLLAILNHYISR